MEFSESDLVDILKKSFPSDSIVNVDHLGGAKCKVYIVSSAFEGKDKVARHRMVYAALGNMLDVNSGFLHAVQIEAFTPEESA